MACKDSIINHNKIINYWSFLDYELCLTNDLIPKGIIR